MNDRTNLVSKVNTALLTIVVGLAAWNLKTTRELEMSVQNTLFKIESVNARVESVQKDIADIRNSAWTLMHMKIWADDLEKKNPTVRVPDPGEIKRNY